MQNKTTFNRAFSAILCIMLITAIALSASGCYSAYKTYESVTETGVIENAELKIVGEGSTEFEFSVTDQDGNQSAYLVKTDKQTVGEALIELGLIEGEEGPYGLYVKTVDGITLDFEKDGKYWAFYVNGEYAMSGVDTTEIENGASYAFKAE